MITTLEQATETLVRAYGPLRIILFGSHATGTAEAGSDFDILVVKHTTKRPIDRQIEVDRLLAPRSIPLDVLVYTPEEVRRLFFRGNPLVEEIVEKGKVLYMRKETHTWLNDAQSDLDVAELLQSHTHLRASCYHSQQCVEKAFKALILERGVLPHRTHDLLELRQQAGPESLNITVEMDDLVFLNNIYRGRYPADIGLLPHGEPTLDETHRAVSLARTIVEGVRRVIVDPQP